MEIEIEAKKDIFNRNVEQLDISNLTKLMTCELCKGLLRLAHTLMECGHTFCKMCLLDYIARFKGKKSAPKCPICQFSIDPNHKKSIFRDTYKQDIVDLLVPESKEKDIGIVKKSIQLFPYYGLSLLLDEVTGEGSEPDPKPNPTRAANEQLLRRLPDVVKNNLNVPYDKYVYRMQEDPEGAFVEFTYKLQITKTTSQQDRKCKVNLFPRSTNDYEWVQIKNEVEIPTTSVERVRRFLEKRFYSKVSETGRVPVTLTAFNTNLTLSVSIKLWFGERELSNLDNLEQLRKYYGQDVLSLEYEVAVPK